jgi:gluconolactonase
MTITSTIPVDRLRTIATGLDHPEGVAASPDGHLYAGGEAGQVYRIDPGSGSVEQIADTGGFILGVALDGRGDLYLCDTGNAAVIRIDADGTVDRYCDAAEGGPLANPNWAAFDADGSLLLSDSGSESLAARDGRLLRVPQGGGDAEVLDLPPLHFPNGLAIAADGTAYVLESFTPRLSRLGDAGLETVVDLPGVVPDGLALDADGGFVIACYAPNRLLHVAADAGVSVLLDDEMALHVPMPTNVAFFGEDRRTLAIASLGGYDISALGVPFAGAPLHLPGNA